MSATVLVATPHLAFGELLRLSLEEEGRYRVRLVRTAREAASIATHPTCQVAILDGDLPDMHVVELGSQLLARLPHLKIVLIPPDNDLNHPSLNGMVYHGHILRPFYLPDLMALMENLTNDGSPAAAAPQPTRPDAETFERALAASNAMAGVVLFGQEDSLSGGALPPAVSDELKKLATRALLNGDRTDLVRFVRLPGQNSDHLFYITPIEAGRALGLAYTVGTPLSRVRVQAAQVARALAPAHHASPTVEAARTIPPAESSPPAPSIPADLPMPPEEELAEDEGEFQEINLAALLGSVPPPDPGRPAQEEIFAGWVPEISMSLPRPASEALFPWEQAETAQPVEAPAVQEQAHLPEPDLDATQPVLTSAPPEQNPPAQPAKPTSPEPDLAQTMPVQTAAPAAQAFLQLDEPPVDELEDTKPRVLTHLTHIGQLEPVSPAFSQLSYTCVLIPRLPQHHLTGLLSEKLGQWVQQYCLAFGWRLEGIAIRPEYLQWTVQVSPAIAPGNLMRIIRQRVSDSIFESFPALAQQNPSGDFWATGYLIVGGPQPPSPRLLRDYIAETRRRQGVTYPGGEPLALPSENQARLPKG